MNWEKVTWEKVLTIKNGKNQKAVADPNGPFPIYGSGGIMGYANEYLCEAGATIIGRKGSINNPIYVETKFWNVDTAFGLCAKPNLDPKFLYYFCLTYNFLKHNKATTLPSLTKADLLKIKIPLPPLEEQKKISAILNAADILRQKDKALISKYEELTQSLFLNMFGDPVANPNGWEVGTVRDLVVEAKYGTSAKAEADGEYPYLRMNNITYTGYMDYSELKFIDVPEKDKPKYIVRKGDVLFNRTNSKELVGKTGIIESNEPMIIAGYLIRVRTNELANPNYLWAHLNSKWAKMTLVNLCKSIVGMANINAQELQDIKVLKAPINLQNLFAERVQQIVKQKQLAQQSLQKSEELFNSLLQRAFKGELTKSLEPAFG